MKPLLLDPTQILAVHRRRYPDGLVCQTCGRLLAATGYDGREYTCAECKSDAREKARAFERMRGRLKPLTEAQLKEADAYCSWCRRWFSTKAGGGGMTCSACQTSQGGGWALPGQIAPARALKAVERGTIAISTKKRGYGRSRLRIPNIHAGSRVAKSDSPAGISVTEAQRSRQRRMAAKEAKLVQARRQKARDYQRASRARKKAAEKETSSHAA